MIVKPGIHSLSFERYRSAAGVSKSMLDILAASTPMHLQAYVMSDQEPETPAQRFGTTCTARSSSLTLTLAGSTLSPRNRPTRPKRAKRGKTSTLISRSLPWLSHNRSTRW